MNKRIHAELPLLPQAPATSAISYLSRMNRLWERMADDSVCILVSNPEAVRSRDTHFPFRQNSDILYLNGFPEPNSVLVICKLKGKQNVIMFVQPKNKERETWDGVRFGVLGARKQYFANTAYDVADFEKVLSKLLEAAQTVYYSFNHNIGFDEIFSRVFLRKQKTLVDPKPILAELRLVKSAEELAVMRHAALISAEAHKQAMQACSPGIREEQLQAVLEFVFKAAGAVAPAYGSIVAAGNNACVLHYVENNCQIKDGDLVLIDAGCEFGSRNGGYAADITRCFPANGRFSQAQQEVYELVLKAQLAAISKARPGVRLIAVQQAAERVLRRGLKQLGILSGSKELSLSDFLPHGTSHWLGIDVHDVGSYDRKDRISKGRKQRMLEPGMVITVEPGLYFNKSDRRIPARFRGIGVRIEDDVVITASGNEVITSAVPKTVEEIEALMAR